MPPHQLKPLRILHCGCFHLRKHGLWYQSIDQKITNGLIRNGHSVENFSYRDVARAEAIIPHKRLGIKKVNEALRNYCRNFEPDLLLLGSSELIASETVAAIKQDFPNIKVAMWYCDPLWMEEKLELMKRWARLCDVVFATTAGHYLEVLSQQGAVAAHIPNPVDFSIETLNASSLSTWESDLFFAGSEKGEPGRTEFLAKLKAELPELRFGIYKAFGNPSVLGRAYFRVIGNSMMGLNLSRKWDIPWYSSDRIAHLMGNGTLTFCPRTQGLTTLFSSNAAGWFETHEELIEKIKHYFQNPDEARKTAAQGRLEIFAKCETTLVTRWMVELIFGTPHLHTPEWSGEVYRG